MENATKWHESRTGEKSDLEESETLKDLRNEIEISLPEEMTELGKNSSLPGSTNIYNNWCDNKDNPNHPINRIVSIFYIFLIFNQETAQKLDDHGCLPIKENGDFSDEVEACILNWLKKLWPSGFLKEEQVKNNLVLDLVRDRIKNITDSERAEKEEI